jgi:hypothetical protein
LPQEKNIDTTHISTSRKPQQRTAFEEKLPSLFIEAYTSHRESSISQVKFHSVMIQGKQIKASTILCLAANSLTLTLDSAFYPVYQMQAEEALE